MKIKNIVTILISIIILVSCGTVKQPESNSTPDLSEVTINFVETQATAATAGALLYNEDFEVASYELELVGNKLNVKFSLKNINIAAGDITELAIALGTESDSGLNEVLPTLDGSVLGGIQHGK